MNFFVMGSSFLLVRANRDAIGRIFSLGMPFVFSGGMIRTETAKVRNAPGARGNARAGASKIIVLLLPCPLSPVPGGNSSKLDAGVLERLRGVAVSFLITTAPGNADLAQNPVRKGGSIRAARNREMVRATITGT